MDSEELGVLIELHGKAIYNFCFKLTGNKQDADDLYQETFLKAMEVRHKISTDKNPKSFLISITLGLWKNSRRKFAWRRRIAPEAAEWGDSIGELGGIGGEVSPEDTVLSNELRSMIQEATETLEDKFKIPLYMYYTAEMSIDEIAAALHIPSGTVKSRLYQARQLLKTILEASLREPYRPMGETAQASIGSRT